MSGTSRARSTSRRCVSGAQALLGRHDFAAFQSTGGDVHTTERTILSIAVEPERGQTGVRPWSDHGLTPLVIRVTATASCATWCATSPARWSTSASAAGQPSEVGEILACRDRTRAGPRPPRPRDSFSSRVDYA